MDEKKEEKEEIEEKKEKINEINLETKSETKEISICDYSKY